MGQRIRHPRCRLTVLRELKGLRIRPPLCSGFSISPAMFVEVRLAVMLVEHGLGIEQDPSGWGRHS